MSTPTTAAAVLETHMEIRITGAIAAVWKALTEDIGAWWPQEFYAGGEPEKRRYYRRRSPAGGCTKPGRTAAACSGPPWSR
jgi:hypothetical protein